MGQNKSSLSRKIYETAPTATTQHAADADDQLLSHSSSLLLSNVCAPRFLDEDYLYELYKERENGIKYWFQLLPTELVEEIYRYYAFLNWRGKFRALTSLRSPKDPTYLCISPSLCLACASPNSHMISLWDLRSVSVSMELSSSWGCIPPSPIPPSSVVPRHLASGYARGAEISAITFSDDYLVVGGKHFRMCPIEVWDTRGGGKHPGHYKTLSGHGKPIVALAPGKRSQTVWSASKDHTVVLWDICTGARLIVFDLERPPSCLQCSGNTLFIGGDDVVYYTSLPSPFASSPSPPKLHSYPLEQPFLAADENGTVITHTAGATNLPVQSIPALAKASASTATPPLRLVHRAAVVDAFFYNRKLICVPSQGLVVWDGNWNMRPYSFSSSCSILCVSQPTRKLMAVGTRDRLIIILELL